MWTEIGDEEYTLLSEELNLNVFVSLFAAWGKKYMHKSKISAAIC